jgi:regulator of replication initiation timing
MLCTGHTIAEDDLSISLSSSTSYTSKDDEKDLLRESLENLIAYCIPIIEEIKQDISKLSIEVQALKQNFNVDEAIAKDSAREFEELRLTETVKLIETEKNKKQKKKKLHILKTFKYGTLRLMKFFKDPFSTDEAKELCSPHNVVHGLSSPHSPLFRSHAILLPNNYSYDDQPEILQTKAESVDISVKS